MAKRKREEEKIQMGVNVANEPPVQTEEEKEAEQMAAAVSTLPDHDLNITIELPDRTLKGEGRIVAMPDSVEPGSSVGLHVKLTRMWGV